MMKLLFFGLWGALAALAGHFAVGHFGLLPDRTASAKPTPAVTVERKTTPAVSVPVVRNGVIEGYAVFQFAYSLEKRPTNGGPLAPEAILLDEIYRIVYGDEKLDFKRTDRYDLSRIPPLLERKVGERLGADIVKDILIREFNFIPRDKIRT